MTVNEIVNKPKFIALSELDNKSCSFSRLGERDTFYCGNGIYLGFSRNKFDVKDNVRIEFGNPGIYIISVSVFNRPEYAKIFYRLSVTELNNDIVGFTEKMDFIPNLIFGMSFKEAQNVFAAYKKPGVFHQEGESRGLNDNKVFVFQYDYIKYDNVTYYFFGSSKKGTLQGFTYFLK